MDDLVLDEYRLEQELGSGSFGRVVAGVSVRSHARVAVKLEPRVKGKPRLLQEEVSVLAALQGAGIPKLLGSGKFHSQTCLVMELLGPTLQNKFRELGREFALKTVIEVADQALERIEFVHDNFYLHRDIKPQNFMFGLGAQQSTLYLSDFGLAKKFQNGPFGLHVPYKEDKSFVGTACYASLNTHLGIQQSRRDDVESLLYVVCYLLRGKLPWSSKYLGNTAKHNAAKMQKMLIRPDELFAGCPKGFTQAMMYARSLQFEEKPDYAMLRSVLRGIAAELRIVIDRRLEWLDGDALSANAVQKPKKKLLRGQSANPKRMKNSHLVQTEGVRLERKLSLRSSQPGLHVDLPGPVQPSKDSDEEEHTSYHEPVSDSSTSEDTVKDLRGPTINRAILSALSSVNMRRTPQGSAKPKRRSTSRKRSTHQSTAKPAEEDDDLLVKALNERANSDREVLVSKDHYEELKQAKKTLKLTSAQLASANKELAELQLELKAQQAENARLQKEMKTSLDKRRGDSQEVKELTYANSQLTKQLEDARSAAQEQHRSHQTVLNKLRASLSDIEKVVSSRATAANRHIGRCQSVLAQVTNALAKDVSKSAITRLVSDVGSQLTQLHTTLTSSDVAEPLDLPNTQVVELEEENAKLKEDLQRLQSNEDLLEQYRAAIEKMREQIQLLRDRVRELEGSDDLKRQLEDRDARISLLSREKDMLNDHIKTLQATLNEQRAVIENLRGIITKVTPTEREESRFTGASPRADKRRTPSITDFPRAVKVESAQEDLDSRIEKVYIGESNELNIQAEIATLDQEIFQLQSSLQRALDNP